MRWRMSTTMGMTTVAVVLLASVMAVGAWPEQRQRRTPPTRCIPPNPCFPSRQEIAELAANITGSVYQPSDAEYPDLVTSLNRRLTRHPSIVVVVANERDVQTAVLFARRYHLHLTVTAANGDFTRGSYADASLQINLSQMQGITINANATTFADAGTITAQPGVRWPQLIARADLVNRDVVGQGYWDVPIGEQTQAGGFGTISRTLGLFSDNLLSARMVTMGGSVIEVSDLGATITTYDGISRYSVVDPGLWNALRGGGANNFGIVTSYTFLMHLAPAYVTQVSASYLLYQNEQFVGRDPLKYLLPLVYALPNVWGGMVFLDGRTSETTVGQKGTLTLQLLHYGAAYNSATYQEVNPILAYDGDGSRLAAPSVVNRTGVNDFNTVLRSSLPWPGSARMYAFETLLPAEVFTDSEKLDDFVDTLLLLLNDPAVNAQYFCALQPLGGVINTINSTGYVTDAVRNAAMSLMCQLTWEDSDAIRDDAFVNYAISFGKRLKAFGVGTSLGFGLFEDEEDWKHTLYGDNYKELVRVKTKYDVDNYLWCHNCVASDYRLDCRRGCERYAEEERARRLEELSEENERRILKFLGHEH